MKKFKKVLAAVLAGTMVLSSMIVSTFAAQDTDDLADGTAYLSINNADWGEYDAEWVNAEITGNGDYVVSMTASEAQNLAQFNALEIKNGEKVFGFEYIVTITSIKFNGTEVKNADGYTCSADGKGETTRVNIYNEWNSPDSEAVAGDDDHIDNRCTDGDVMSKSAKMIDAANLEGVTSVEVAFTVSGLADDTADTGTGDSSVALILVAVAALAVVATVSVKKYAVER